jgi:hypothetical protein
VETCNIFQCGLPGILHIFPLFTSKIHIKVCEPLFM